MSIENRLKRVDNKGGILEGALHWRIAFGQPREKPEYGKRQLFIAFQNGNSGLYWIYNGYLFSLSGDLNKNKLADLAYSTKIVHF